MPHVTVKGGHFLQEDSPEDLVDTIHKTVLSTPDAGSRGALAGSRL